MSFWGELKRRNVFKVGAAYLIAAWLILQVASITFPALNLPSWALTFLTVFLIIGFFIAIILAWAYEVTPDGVKLTKKVSLADSITHVTGRKLNYVLVGLLVIAVVYICFLKFYPGKPTVQTDVLSTVAEQTPFAVEVKESPKTIAVLPFDDLSPEKDQEYFVVGLSEELLNTLTKIPDLLVTAKTSSFAFKGTDKTVQDIAEVLGVAHILEGSVRKAGNALRITAQLIRASDGFHLWSESYDRELKDVADILSIQEDIATAVANELKVTLGIGKSLKQLGGTDNVEAYEFYLIALGKLVNYTLAEASQARESFDSAIAIDPEFALAWAMRAYMQNFLVIMGPANRAAAERDEALIAAQKSIELEPNLADGYCQLSFIKLSRGKFIEAELAYQKGLELKTETLGSTSLMGGHYLALGYFRKANEFLETLRRNDPLNKVVRDYYMMNFALLGDIDRAEDEYERSRALLGSIWPHANEFITNIRLSANDVLSSNIVFSNRIYDIEKEYLYSPKDGLVALRQIYNNSDSLTSAEFMYISVWAAYFGDFEFALDAIEKGVSIEASGLFHIWLPVMKDIRQLPRFKEFVREIGLVDYWDQFGWPNICHPTDNGDFVCE